MKRSESDGTDLSIAEIKKGTVLKTLAILFLVLSNNLWANELHMYSKENNTISGVLVTEFQTYPLEAIVSNRLVEGIINQPVTIKSVSDGTGDKSVSDGTGDKSVSDGTGYAITFINKYIDDLVFDVKLTECDSKLFITNNMSNSVILDLNTITLDNVLVSCK